ncbi:MAG: SBBP repeat-containing protein [Nanoarchaeota archaeon]|nr:SBBP repeat-containing protein [Nanoarchaeota archaeon]
MDEHTSNGGIDIFLSKFDSCGEFIGACTWGGPVSDGAYGLTVDTSGNVYVTGYFKGTVDFDPGDGTEERASVEGWSSDAFLSKFDSDGDFQWARIWGGSDYDFGEEVAVDELGNIYVAGHFNSNTADFDPGPGSDEQTCNGGSDVYLSKFDSDGHFLWALTWGGKEEDRMGGIATDFSGNVYVTGHFQATVDFDPGPGSDEHAANAYRAAFLSKFDSNGDYDWVRIWGHASDASGLGVTVDDYGAIYTTGYFTDTVDFDPGPGTDEHTANSFDTYLTKFDSNGDFEWARTWGGAEGDLGCEVVSDHSSSVFITGYFTSSADFDPGPGSDERLSNGGRDVFLSKFTSGGDYDWVCAWGGEDDDWGYGVAVDSSGNSYVTGYFRYTVDFDPGPGVDNHTSNGSSDVYLSKFLPDGSW